MQAKIRYAELSTLLGSCPIPTIAALIRLTPIALLALCDRRPDQRYRDRLAPLVTLLNLMVQHREYRKQASEGVVVLYEEFVLQRILGIFAHSGRKPSSRKVRFALSWLRGYEVRPVFLGIRHEEAEARVERRSGHWPRRWAAFHPRERSEALAQQAVLLDELYLLSPGATWVDTNCDLGECAERVLASLENRGSVADSRPSTPSVGHFVFNLTSYSGAACQALALARQCENVDSIVFNVERGRRQTCLERHPEDHLRVIHLPSNPIRAFLTIARFARLNRIEIFHIHGFIGVGLLSGWILRRKLLLKSTLLGSDDLDAIGRRRLGAILLWIAKRVDRNVAVSSAIGEINKRHLSAELVERLPNGVEIGKKGAGDALRKSAPVFCTVGLVCERKRTHLAIEKFLAEFSGLQTAAKLYVVGPAGDNAHLDEGGQAYLERCQALVSPLQRKQVIFTGQLSRAAVEAIYEESLAILCFSQYEGMPNVLLEAMAANCVPITSDIAGVACEIISCEQDGFVVGDTDRLPSLERLVECSAGKGPRHRIEKKFDLAMIAARYEGLYRELREAH